jgi:hypothetical protein
LAGWGISSVAPRGRKGVGHLQALKKLEAGVNGVWVGIGVLAAGLLWNGADSLADEAPLSPGAQHSVGEGPRSVAIDDLNGDQAPDPAVANTSFAGSDNVSMLLNQRPQLGDLNCDGKVDFDDIDPFVLALGGPAAYYAA